MLSEKFCSSNNFKLWYTSRKSALEISAPCAVCPTQPWLFAVQAGEPNYQQLLADLEKEMDKVKEDAAENARMLREEASRAKEAASLARAESARALADAAFEKQRADRQNEYLEEQRLQMQQVTEHSTKYQVAAFAFVHI